MEINTKDRTNMVTPTAIRSIFAPRILDVHTPWRQKPGKLENTYLSVSFISIRRLR